MDYTRKFFEAILSTYAIIMSMWLFFFAALIFSFLIFFFFDIVVSPIYPFGLVLIKIIFGEDGILDTFIGIDD